MPPIDNNDPVPLGFKIQRRVKLARRVLFRVLLYGNKRSEMHREM